MANVGWRYYILFCIANATNALFFYLFLPETARRPLEEMNYIFSHAPWLVPGSDKDTYQSHDLEATVRAYEEKSKETHAEDVKMA